MSGICRTIRDAEVVYCAIWVESRIYLFDLNKMCKNDIYLMQFWKVFIFFQNSEIRGSYKDKQYEKNNLREKVSHNVI